MSADMVEYLVGVSVPRVCYHCLVEWQNQRLQGDVPEVQNLIDAGQQKAIYKADTSAKE